MDDADRAELEQERAMERALAERAMGRPIGVSALFCVDCGEPIPLARRQAVPGVMCCVPCQQARDRRALVGI